MPSLCPICTAPLDTDGLCPMCLIAGGFATTSPGPQTLDNTIGDTLDPHPSDTEVALEYDNFGPFEIRKVLGEGGMGTVYLARQSSPISRDVALKVVKPGMDTAQILSRFNYERQALAGMDHPNIARVYEAGSTQKGRPFFVMEYIDGQPITTYCDSHRLNTAERLALFRPVCQALRHAHQKGIIHRDIKPSNVLVTEVDGIPVPKVIDFGIAKATGHNAIDSTSITQLGQLVGTPEYMSPEAADVMAGDIDTSSDVYSLGVLLYELLIGAVPFDGNMLRRAGLLELMRIIREVDAPPMTARITQLGLSGPEIAARRRTDLPGLKRAIQGDLNWIVSKAIEKSRQRRYPSAADLLSDIERHLDNKPVEAGPPTVTYRLGKFVRRHRGPVLASAAIALIALAGVAATIWQGREAAAQRDAARAALAMAQQSRAEALAAKQRAEKGEALARAGLIDVRSLASSMLFDVSDQVRQLSGSTAARDSLTRLGTQYLERGGISDDLLGPAWFTIAELQGDVGQGDLSASRESYKRSIALFEKQLALSPNHSHIIQQLAQALVRLAVTEESQQRRILLATRAQSLLQPLLKHEPNQIKALHTLAEAHIALLQSQLAVQVEERIASLGARSFEDRLLWARTMADSVAVINTTASDRSLMLGKAIAEADSLLKLRPGHFDLTFNRAKWSILKHMASHDLGNHDQAFREATEGIQVLERLAAEDPKRTSLLFYLGNSLRLVGIYRSRFGDRKLAFEDAGRASRLIGEASRSNPNIQEWAMQFAHSFRDLSIVARAAQNYDDSRRFASQAASEATSVMRRFPSSNTPRRLFVELQCDLATDNSTLKRFPEAQTSLDAARSVIKLLLRARPQLEDWITSSRFELTQANLYRDQNRFKEALPHSLQAFDDAHKAMQLAPDYVPLDDLLMATTTEVARNYSRNGRFNDALDFNFRLVKLAESRLKSNPRSELRRNLLWSPHVYIRQDSHQIGKPNQSLAASRRMMELTGQWHAESPSSQIHRRSHGFSWINYISDLSASGRRAEALSALASAWRFISGNFDQSQASAERLGYLGQLSSLLNFWLRLDSPEIAISEGRRHLEAVRSLTAFSANRMDDLLGVQRFYSILASAAEQSAQLPESLQLATLARQAFERRNVTSPGDLITLASSMATIASLNARLGHPDQAIPGWREAIKNASLAVEEADRRLIQNPGNIALMQAAFQAELTMACVHEYLGESLAALNATKRTWSRLEARSRVEPPGSISSIRPAVTGLLALNLQQAGLPIEISWFGVPVSPSEVTASIPRGYTLKAIYMRSFAFDPNTRMQLSEKAVAAARALFESSDTPANRSILSHTLWWQAAGHHRLNQLKLAQNLLNQALRLIEPNSPNLDTVLRDDIQVFLRNVTARLSNQ